MGSTYNKVSLKCIGIRSKHLSALYKGDKNEDSHKAKRFSLQRIRNYFDYRLKENQQVEDFVLTLRVL